MKNVLVTGGAGYIGSHVCKALAAAGCRPIAFDNLSAGHAWAVKWGPLERGDILDSVRLEEVLRAHKPIAVMHFAALAYVGESVDKPDKYYRNNVVGTLSLLDAMRVCDVSKIVFSSSCATYGIPETIPISEGSSQSPINPYGRTKLMMEQVLKDYGSSYGLRSVTLRYFNAAGADPDGEIGEDHDPETHLVPIVLETAAGLRKAVTVFGDDYGTPDGTCIRDYIHVADLADAHVRAIDALNGTGPAKFYNLGTGTGFSVLEIIKAAQDVTERPIQKEIGPRRPGDPPVLIADGSFASRELQWRPRYSDLRVMLEHAWRWLSRNSIAARERV